MNWIIEKALRPKIATLPFIDRYGAIVDTVKVNVGNKTKSFPVSNYVSQKQCFEDGLYTALVPDDKYKSVSYFEIVSNGSPTYSGAKKNDIQINPTLRFVCWLNLQKLGVDDHPDRMRYIMDFMSVVKGRTTFDIDGIKGVLDVNDFNVPELDHERVFRNYSYKDKQKFFFFPFSFFAVELSVNVKANAACFNQMAFTDALSCPPSVILPEVTNMVEIWS